MISKLVMKYLVAFFMIIGYGRLAGQKEIDPEFFKNNHVVIYKSSKREMTYMIEDLESSGDTIIRRRITIYEANPSIEKIYYKYSKKRDDIIKSSSEEFMLDTDSLVLTNSNSICYLDGKIFIDLSAPPYSEDNALNDCYLFIERKQEDSASTFFDFKYLNIFESDSQYSFRYQLNQWVVSYVFSNNERFDQIFHYY